MTLIEVVMAIVIAGILAAVAMRSVVTITETGRTEATKAELDDIGYAIVGNPALENNGTRSDFGYVGDVGAMPPNLDALMNNPEGYVTWNGPYVKNRFEQVSNDYKTDAWGAPYSYNGVDITSSGSGTNIVYKIGESTSDFLLNKVTGNVYDADGTPPGNTYSDSISILLTYPNGAGSFLTKGITPDLGGYFAFDSIPIGNHDLNLIYNPTNDTLKRFVSVLPKSTTYGEYIFPSNYWGYSSGGGNSGLNLVNGSARVSGGGCNNIKFDVENTNTTDVTITSVTPSWTTPTSYFKVFSVGGVTVFDSSNPRSGSGQTVSFSSVTINAGQTVSMSLEGFKNNPTGGPDTDLSNVDITITFSNGTVITFNTGAC